MSSNIGKIFESQWKSSVPDYALLYRLPDPAQSFGGSNNLRFSAKPPFDYLLWDSARHILFALELKTVQESSISFERTKDDKGKIHFSQIANLNSWNKYDGIVAGFVIEFRQIEKTVFIEISEFNKLLSLIDKKSFNYNDLDEHSIKYITIAQEKLRTRYKYDINGFLSSNSFELVKKS